VTWRRKPRRCSFRRHASPTKRVTPRDFTSTAPGHRTIDCPVGAVGSPDGKNDRGVEVVSLFPITSPGPCFTCGMTDHRIGTCPARSATLLRVRLRKPLLQGLSQRQDRPRRRGRLAASLCSVLRRDPTSLRIPAFLRVTSLRAPCNLSLPKHTPCFSSSKHPILQGVGYLQDEDGEHEEIWAAGALSLVAQPESTALFLTGAARVVGAPLFVRPPESTAPVNMAVTTALYSRRSPSRPRPFLVGVPFCGARRVEPPPAFSWRSPS
jgi:hypothetical protein